MSTPKTVFEAVENAIKEYLSQPKSNHQPYKDVFKRHFNDYLAQRFGAAVLKAESPAEEQRLLDLLREITSD